MCYAFKPVRTSDGRIYKIPLKEYVKLEREGIVKESADGYHYARSTVGAIIFEGRNFKVLPMRWDMIHSGYMSEHPELSLAEVIKRKNSEAKGFESFNARKETLPVRLSFKDSWREGKRCVMPLVSFLERANKDDAPPEFKNRTWMIDLHSPQYFGGLWAYWARNGESLHSCTVVTMDSEGHPAMTSIYHERHPLILTEEEAAEWLDPGTTPKRAMEMIHQFDSGRMTLTELVKPKKIKSSNQTSLF